MKLKSSEELIKYLTERAVGYISLPKDKDKLQLRRKQHSWGSHWFGMLPVAIQLWRNKKKS